MSNTKTYIARSDEEAQALHDGTQTLLVIPWEQQAVKDYRVCPYAPGDVIEFIQGPIRPITIEPQPEMLLYQDRLTVTTVAGQRVQEITPEQMLAAGLDAYGWDYAEGSDPEDDGAMFMYWVDYPNEPPPWAARTSSCECIEDIFRLYWDWLHPRQPWSSNPRCWFVGVEQ
jgi:hypothetical protein